jgi:hypothetical protein
MALETNQDPSPRTPIPNSVKPASKARGLADFDHGKVYPCGYMWSRYDSRMPPSRGHCHSVARTCAQRSRKIPRNNVGPAFTRDPAKTWGFASYGLRSPQPLPPKQNPCRTSPRERRREKAPALPLYRRRPTMGADAGVAARGQETDIHP